jgi:hypothetical protein
MAKINIQTSPENLENARVQLNYLDNIKNLFGNSAVIGNSAVTSSESVTFEPSELGVNSVQDAKIEAILLVLLREAYDSALLELDPCMEVKRTYIFKTISGNKQVLGEQFIVKIFSAENIEDSVDPNTL